MDGVIRIKEWINEHVPLLSRVYENKYVGMLYDRFASLPPKQQRQSLWAIFGGFSTLVLGYLLWSYIDLWSTTSKANESYSMANMLIQYQKQRRDKSQAIRSLSRNSQLSNPGQMKQVLIDLGRSATISPRMITAEEQGGGNESEDSKSGGDVQMKRATVTLSRVTLTQLKNYLQSVEHGQYDLSISSMRVTNDDKIRGYMKVELGVVGYLFDMDEG
jgi:hypothetical protein